MDHDWDCIVVGAGAAGLSAALVLGRARRRTLVLDAGEQSNRAAHGIGGMLGQDGRPADDFYADGRKELAAYPSVEVRDVDVVGGEPAAGGFALTCGDGRRETARTVLLATGMAYRWPDLPGAAERWGTSVFHCPFCHGWEVREQPLAVFGDSSVHRPLLLTAWSDDVTLLSAEVGDEDRGRLEAAGVTVDAREVVGLRGEGEALEAVVFADGTERSCGGLLVAVTLHQRSDLAAQLGAEYAAATPLTAEGIATGGMGPGATTVPGLYVAGDASGQMPSVANAIASGSNTAGSIVGWLSGAL
ncbi:MAG: NAD(P)/FAD-dependent oxidoreductase [Solirubrobacteraceae bacterium]|nr:NAD(P)/FAD-dependent oxidoreductase [Solirubrobacteraceae bacterium]